MGVVLHDLAHRGTAVSWIADAAMRSAAGLGSCASERSSFEERLAATHRRMRGYKPDVAQRVPQPLAALIEELQAVEPGGRPSARDARTRLTAFAAQSLEWELLGAAFAAMAAAPVDAVAVAAAGARAAKHVSTAAASEYIADDDDEHMHMNAGDEQ